MTTTTRPERSIRLLRPPNMDGVGVFCIRVKRDMSFYTFREIPCAIGGRGFAIHKLGLGQLYHVRIGTNEDCSCECLGYLRHGHCRHILGLLALVRHQKL
ncbi:MAG: SWIM zinc finger family protein [Fimbriimonadaceae bacterium]